MSLKKTNEYLLATDDWGRVPNCCIMHYTSDNPDDPGVGLADHFNWVRMIRPAGGGAFVDDFSKIERKKFSNGSIGTY